MQTPLFKGRPQGGPFSHVPAAGNGAGSRPRQKGGSRAENKEKGGRNMEFKLLKKLADLRGTELILLLVAVALLAVLVIAIRRYDRTGTPAPGKRTRTLVFGALCLTLSFVLSYFKLFSISFGGSVTLCSMLPIMLFAYVYGPGYGFLAAFAYALLQVVQGAYIVHPVQFILDYFVAFTCYGIPALFPKNLYAGVAAGGTARLLASTVSGAVFFASAGLELGYADPWAYSFIYNLLTIGIDTALTLIAAALLPMKRFESIMRG